MWSGLGEQSRTTKKLGCFLFLPDKKTRLYIIYDAVLIVDNENYE
jgi:hypothetical protein